MDEARLRERLARLPAATSFVPPDAAGTTDRLTPAAVLVAIALGETPGVLLTKRTSRLARHPGQVCFPGGRIEPGDGSPAAAALREAGEEIGLEACAVSLLGRLPDHATGTGFRITPVVGIVGSGVRLSPAPAEVEALFALPMTTLLDAAAPYREVAERDGRRREFWVWPHPKYNIWGATAAILLSLAVSLRD